MHLFYDHVNDILSENIQSILEKNLSDKDIIKSNKNLDLNNVHSHYAGDLFKSIFNTIEFLSEDIKNQLLFQVIKVVLNKMQEIQKSNDKYLEELEKSDELV